MIFQLICRLAALAAWTSALILCAAILLVAADSGGVLPWTQWAAAVACLVALTCLLPQCAIGPYSGGPHPGSWRSYAIAMVIIAMAGWGFVQSLPLSSTVANSLAPGSASAYSAWLGPLWDVPADAALLQGTRTRITVDETLTRSAAWLTVLIAGYAALASQLFTNRSRLQLLLIVLAIGGAAQAGLGVYQLLTAPDATVWGIRSQYGGRPFGTFVNRSNAAVMLNIGLAASLGIIAWRLAALTGAPLNGERFPLNELLDVAFDRLSMLAIITAGMSILGLLVCGSRSGLVGLVGGFLLALGMVQSAHKYRGLVATIVGLGVIVAIALVNLDLSAISLERLSGTAEDIIERSELHDARFEHWSDAFAAAIHQPLTGWGWGAYRYAYLPFQKSGAGVWFINADNLWLEIFVETGLVGIAFLLVGLVVLIRALNDLGASAEPIDHGLTITGWFALGAMVTSQFFDFGLRIPANSIMIAVLFSVVVARRYASGPQAIAPKWQKSFKLGTQLPRPNAKSAPAYAGARLVSLLILVAACLSIIAAADALSRHAAGDKAIRMARRLPPDARTNVQAANGIAESLVEHLRVTPRDSDALQELSRLKAKLARIEIAQSLSRATPDSSTEELLQSLSRAPLRATWHSKLDESQLPLFSDAHPSAIEIDPEFLTERLKFGDSLAAARESAVASLAASPLSPEARFAVLTLDYAGGDPKQSSALLQQAATLRKQTAEVLLYIGDLAAEAGDWAFAASSWKRVARLKSNFTPIVLNRASSAPSLRPDDVIPDSRDSLRIAVAIEVKKVSPDAALLSRAVDSLGQSLPDDKIEKATQLQLIAKIQQKLNRPDEASKVLHQATQIRPRDVNLRLEYVAALLKADQLDQARDEARIGRQIAPTDPRFETLMQTIAKRLDAGLNEKNGYID